MATTVLVAYATKYGSTKEVAEAVAATLREHGLEAEVRPVHNIRSLDGYSAVVLSAALYMGHWHRDARTFLRRHRKALLNVPVAIFSLGPLSTAEKEKQSARAQLDRALATFYWLTPVAVEVFGGAIDPARLHFPFNHMPKGTARDLLVFLFQDALRDRCWRRSRGRRCWSPKPASRFPGQPKRGK